MRTIVLAAILATACGLAAAQPVYRCGSSYSQTPCQGATTVETSDPRTAADAARAEAATRADAKRADALEKARLAQEAKAPKAVVLATPQVAAAEAAKPAGKPPAKLAKGGKLEQFTAVSPRPLPEEKKKKKAKDASAKA